MVKSKRKGSSKKAKKARMTKKASGLVATFKKLAGTYPPYYILKTAYGEYNKLSPEQQELVKGALIKAGIALLV